MEKLIKLPVLNMDSSETGCCPKFEPEAWDEKIMELEGLPMVRAFTRSFLHMPLNMGRVMADTMEKIRAAGKEKQDGYLILSRDISSWKGEHLFLVEGSVPGMENILFSGTFITKVYDGDFRMIPTWIKDLEDFVQKDGKRMKDVYAFYTTCPKCAKYYSHNYVVLFAEIE